SRRAAGGGASEYGRDRRRTEVRGPAGAAGLERRQHVRSRQEGGRKPMKMRLFCGLAEFAVTLTACGNNPSPTGSTLAPPPTANLKPLDKVDPAPARTEGQLTLSTWEGYVDDSWVKTFTANTGCQVHAQYAGSSDQMVSLMANGGGGQWDMVSASGDADLRLIYSGDVRPMNEKLIPDYQYFQTYFKNPGYNTISGIHYGISLQWGPNVLLYNTNKFKI